MVDPNRVRHMTRMAILEENDADNELNIAQYKWNDFLILRIIISLASGTLAFAALTVLVVLTGWEAVNRFVAGHTMQVCIAAVFLAYAGFMAVVMIVTVILAWRRYQQAGRLNETYRKELDQLEE